MISPRLARPSGLRLGTGALLCLALMATAGAAAPQGAGDSQLTDFRSPEACRDCHKAVYEDYLQTSHSRAMSEIVPGEMEDLFTPEQQHFYVKKDTARSIFYKLVSSDTGYEQQIFTPGKNGPQQLNRLTIDLQLGSGKLSRAFLRRDGDRLFLNPLSYYPGSEQWAFGPGARGHLYSMQGERPITASCLDCHSGYFETRDPSEYTGPKRPLDEFVYLADTFVVKKENAVLPISCAKCHGDSEQHIRYHRQNPDEKVAQHMVKIDDLTQTQQVQVCGFCHTPPGAITRQPFTFQPGDLYTDFVEPEVIDFSNPDPHATQAPFLAVSECFKNTPSMTCSTCHNPHQSERDQLALFSQRCQECHASSDSHCSATAMDNAEATSNCIDCHMPRQASGLRIDGKDGEPLLMQMRTHWIKVHK